MIDYLAIDGGIEAATLSLSSQQAEVQAEVAGALRTQ